MGMISCGGALHNAAGIAFRYFSYIVAPTPAKLGWRESYAYTQGMQAFVFGFPWVFLPELRWKWVTQDPHSAGVPYLPLNQFWNLRQLATAEYRDGGTPNKSKDTPRHPQRHG